MKRFSFLTILIVPFVLSAQESADSLRREVTIEKDFTPIVRDARKSTPSPRSRRPPSPGSRSSTATGRCRLRSKLVPCCCPPGGFGDPARENLNGAISISAWAITGTWRVMPVTASCRVRKTSWACGGNTARPAATVDYNQQLPGYETSRTMRQLEERVVADYRHNLREARPGHTGRLSLRLVQTTTGCDSPVCRHRLARAGDKPLLPQKPDSLQQSRGTVTLPGLAGLPSLRLPDAAICKATRGSGPRSGWRPTFALTAPIDKAATLRSTGAFDYIGYSQLPSASGYGIAVVESPVQLGATTGDRSRPGSEPTSRSTTVPSSGLPRRAIRLGPSSPTCNSTPGSPGVSS